MTGNRAHEACNICGKELLLFKCKYCGKAFCEQHKAPEHHNCTGLDEYRRLHATGMITRPGGGTDVPDLATPAEQHAGHPEIESLYRKGVLAIKLLSVLAIIAVSVLALILLIGYFNTPSWINSIPVSNATGATVVLTNYKNATNPAWDSLMAFLMTDDTINTRYDYPVYTCADFSRALHDKAEAKGIRCGFVAIEFSDRSIDYSIYDNGDGNFSPPTHAPDIGHGLNVFETTDGRTVYVDASSQTDLVCGNPRVRIAYVEEGRELNEIDMDRATDINYSFYESYKRTHLDFIADQRAFYEDLAAHNARVIANGNLLFPELKAERDQLNARAIELNARKGLIGPFYFPIGIVEKVDVYW